MSSPPRKQAKMLDDDGQSTKHVNSSTSPQRPLMSPKASLMMPSSPPPPSTPSGRQRLGLTTNTQQSTVKKLTLKPKAVPNRQTQDPLQAQMTLTRSARAILTSTPTPESLQSLSTLCQRLIAAGSNHSLSLYDKLRLEIEKATTLIRKRLIQSKPVDLQYDEQTSFLSSSTTTTTNQLDQWLQTFQTESKQFLNQILLIRAVFLFLDRTFVLHNKDLLSIWDLGLDLFRHCVLEDEGIATAVMQGLCSLVTRERDGTDVPNTLLQSIISLLNTFSGNVHSNLFVTPFLTLTQSYYKEEGNRLSQQLESSDYLKRVMSRLQEEGERSELVYGNALKGDVIRLVLEEMVSVHVQMIVSKALSDMIKTNQVEDLTTIYNLLSRVNNVAALRTEFTDYIKTTGLEIVLDKSSDDQMIERLIKLRRQSIEIVKECFTNNLNFLESISKGFEFFINKRENKPAEQMAKFIDQKMKSGNKTLDDEELENLFGDVLFLFKFTQGKDMFEAFYKRDLAKRLLLNKSASFDAERNMLLKLKDECGAGFTSKLEIMFKDIELSEDIMKAYNASLSSLTNPLNYKFDLNVSILSQGNWPTYTITNVTLPSTMSMALDRFRTFYTSKYNGRTLSWVHSLDTCVLKAQFNSSKQGDDHQLKNSKKEFSVSLFQTLILLLFNETNDQIKSESSENGRLSYKDICQATRIEPKEVKRLLQSLACGKVRVLQKHPKGREVNDEDEFSFNSEFKDDRVRIKINQIQQSATVEENKATEEKVFTDRSSHLQLAIVRIMKARKTIKYNELVMEIVEQIGSRFKVEPSEIKKNISSLIDREYMRRSENEFNVFEYVA
ncbi:hypothetical protein OIO90_001858 [Microbotryomycetes sp. JL221]|nr:hypothetical protein OIO90_001858 [Microbotryomycetes sp. JL221]